MKTAVKNYLIIMVGSLILVLGFQNCAKIYLQPITGQLTQSSTSVAKWNASSDQLIFENYDGTYYLYDIPTSQLTSFGQDAICLGGASGSAQYYCFSSSLNTDIDGDGVADWIRYFNGACYSNPIGTYSVEVMSKTKVLKTTVLPCSVKDAAGNIYSTGNLVSLPAPVGNVKAGFIIAYQGSASSLNYLYSVAKDGTITPQIIPTAPLSSGNYFQSIFAENDGTIDFLNALLSSDYFLSIKQNYFQTPTTISQSLGTGNCGGRSCISYSSWMRSGNGKPNILFTDFSNTTSQNKISFKVYDSSLSQPLSSSFGIYGNIPSVNQTTPGIPFTADIDGDGSEDMILAVGEYSPNGSGGYYLSGQHIDYYLTASNFSRTNVSGINLLTTFDAYSALSTTNYFGQISGVIYTNNETNAKVVVGLLTHGGSVNAIAILDIKNQKVISGAETPGLSFNVMVPLLKMN